jgi:hypothetical protein
MSITTVKANHCDVCGYEWLKTAKTPKRCANPGCRERNWDRPKAAQPVEALPRDQHIRRYGLGQ